MKSRLAASLVLKLSLFLLSCAFFSQAWWGRTAGAAQGKTIDFNRDIRPILSDKCFACHGPDAVNKNIKLRLDSEAAATADLGRGRRAIIPGDA